MLDRGRYRGALLGALVGDALGAPFEGRRGLILEEDWSAVEAASSPLGYTDDTAMTLALAESLSRCGGLDEDDLAVAFAKHWAAAPGLGYSTRTAAVLERIRSGTPWMEATLGQGRPSNGAAMRVAPAALFAAGRCAETLEVATRSARITHSHPGAVAGARVQAVAIATALCHPVREPVRADGFASAVRRASHDPLLRERLELAAELSRSGDAATIAETIGSGLLVHESVPAAICAFLSHPHSFQDSVALAIRLGSDTDTVASMTGAIAGALLGETAIPHKWIVRTGLGEQVRRLADSLYDLDRSPKGLGPVPVHRLGLSAPAGDGQQALD